MPQNAVTSDLQKDRELESKLRDFGLDPLPVPNGPRVSLIWEPSGQTYLLCGVLIDTDETTYRGSRMSPGGCGIQRPNQFGLVLSLLRSNETGTRLLYWLNTPIAPPEGSNIAFEFNDKNSVVSGLRIASSKPRAIYEEEE